MKELTIAYLLPRMFSVGLEGGNAVKIIIQLKQLRFSQVLAELMLTKTMEINSSSDKYLIIQPATSIQEIKGSTK